MQNEDKRIETKRNVKKEDEHMKEGKYSTINGPCPMSTPSSEKEKEPRTTQMVL